MQALLTTGVLNALAATVVAAGAFAIAAAWRNPFVNRGLWLAVLLKFVIPPLVLLPLIEWPQSEPPRPGAIANLESHVAPQAPAGYVSTVSEVAVSPDSAAPSLPLGSTIELSAASTETSLILPPEPMPSLAPHTSWKDTIDVATVMWLGGALAFSCIALMRVISFHRALTRAALASEAIQRRAAELAAQAGMTATPIVRITSGHTPPLAWRMAYGATILLPAELVERLPAPELDAILAHELMHLRRGDDRYRWLEFAIVTAFWWCPSAWFARRRLHEAEERCCDADVLRTFPALASHYASALLAALDCLAPAPRHVVGTPFFQRGSLVCRFESITASRRPSRPPRAMQWFLGVAGIAVLVITPIAASADADPVESAPGPVENPGQVEVEAALSTAEPPESASPDINQRVTLQFNDGATLSVRLVKVGDTLYAIRPSNRDASEGATDPTDTVDVLVEPRGAAEPPMSLSDIEAHDVWDVSLDECLAIAIKNNRFSFVPTDNAHVLRFAPKPGSKLTFNDACSGLTNQVRDIQDAYWELYFAYRDLDARKIGRDNGLATWRRVKTLERAGSVGGEANAEAQARSQYYLFRAQVEAALANVYDVENRLRYLLGLALNDGRLIRPIDEPSTNAVSFDADANLADAVANRPELIQAQNEVRDRLADLSSAKAALDAAPADDLQTRRLQVAVRHAELLLSREESILNDLMLEVSHQLADAIRDVDLNHSMVDTNANRRAASRDEVAAVGTLYKVGQITLDRVLDAHVRQAGAETAYARSLADYARAIERMHYRRGATLTHHGYKLRQSYAVGHPTSDNRPPITHGWGIPVPDFAPLPEPRPYVDPLP
jgi:beta-lactamase regulating signal transducer with metallopeptidase domain